MFSIPPVPAISFTGLSMRGTAIRAGWKRDGPRMPAQPRTQQRNRIALVPNLSTLVHNLTASSLWRRHSEIQQQ